MYMISTNCSYYTCFMGNSAIKFLFDYNYLFLGNCLGTNYNDGTIQIEKEKTC